MHNLTSHRNLVSFATDAFTRLEHCVRDDVTSSFRKHFNP